MVRWHCRGAPMPNPRKPEVKESNRASVRPSPSQEKRVVAVPRGWLMAGLATFLLPWIVVAAIYLRSDPTATEPTAAPAAAGPTIPAATGPWGRLSKTPIIVSPPLEYVAADWGRLDEPYRWYFPGTSPDLLRAFL